MTQPAIAPLVSERNTPDHRYLVVCRGLACAVEGGSGSLDFGVDLFCCFGPAQRFGVGVPVGCPLFDDVVEVGDAGERAVLEGFAGEDREPAFDEVRPAGAGGREVEVPAALAGLGEPFADGLGLVGGQVVQDDVDVEMARRSAVDVFEEREHVVSGVPFAGRGVHLAGGDVERGEQVDGAVAAVVMVAARPGLSGSDGWVRSNAWIWVFSSKLNTTARSGGSRYSPITSSSLASKSGSAEILNTSVRHGRSPASRQMRATMSLPTP